MVALVAEPVATAEYDLVVEGVSTRASTTERDRPHRLRDAPVLANATFTTVCGNDYGELRFDTAVAESASPAGPLGATTGDLFDATVDRPVGFVVKATFISSTWRTMLRI